MADEFANLSDTVISPGAESKTTTDSKESSTDKVATESKVVTSPELTKNVDAAELGQILLDSGYSKEQLNDLLQAPRTLEAIQYQLRNNPVEFFQTIERNDPKTGEKVIEELADLYVKRYGKKADADDKGDDKGSSKLAAAVESLQERLDRQDNERKAEREAAALATVRQRYQGRVDDLFNLKEVKDLGLTKAEAKAMRASLDVELGKDQGATQRIMSGNFVDVPRAFKGIIDEWATEKKAAADAAVKGREESQGSSFNEFTTGAELVSKLPTGTFDSWDSTEEAFAKVLERTK